MTWTLENTDTRKTIIVGHEEEIHRYKSDIGMVILYSRDDGPFEVTCIRGTPGRGMNTMLPSTHDYTEAQKAGIAKLEEWQKEYGDKFPHSNDQWNERVGCRDDK